MNKKIIIGLMSITVVAALTLGILCNDKLIVSKAYECKEQGLNDKYDFTELVENFRKDEVDITITSADELYLEFDKYEVVDEITRENILAATEDEVLIKFIETESKQFMEIDRNVPDKSIFSEGLEETVKESYSEVITDVDTSYFKRGEDGYKKVTTLTNKYGGKVKVTCIDEPENSKVTRSERVVDTFEENIYKDYNDRKFTYTFDNSNIIIMETTFGYTLEYGCIKARYIKGRTENKVSPSGACELVDKDITKDTSENIGEEISAYATYKMNAFGAFWGGLEVGTYEIRMRVIQGADSNHPTKCGMMITQKAKALVL